MIIDGKKIAAGILERLKQRETPKKFFALVSVSSDAQTESFVREKERMAKELNVDFRRFEFPPDITQDKLRREVLRIAEHRTCGGVVVQLPLPQSVQGAYVANAIPREKDVDVLGERALGAFYTGRNPVNPPAVEVVRTILETAGRTDLRSAHVIVLGAGVLVGKPIGTWCIGKAGKLSVIERDAPREMRELQDADIVVSGTGVGGLFGAESLKDGALVIDFGYDGSSGKFRGDFTAPDKDGDRISYTKTPGGTGPILVAKVLENFFLLNT